MGRLEFVREFREDLRAGEVACGRVVGRDVSAAAAEHLADRGRGKVRRLRRDVVRAEQREDLVGIPEETTDIHGTRHGSISNAALGYIHDNPNEAIMLARYLHHFGGNNIGSEPCTTFSDKGVAA